MSQFLKKAFTFSVVVTTVLWAVGLAAFVPVAQAATSGDLIKASGAAVYYLGANGKRYVFPNEKTFKTWYSNFSSVITITDAELAAIMIGGNVTYRPGTKMIKITTDPKVYAVDANGTLRWIQTEAVAVALYGSTWNQMVEDVSDAFFTNYTIGSPIASASDYNKTAVMNTASSINADKGLGSSGTTTAANVTASVASDTPAGATLPKSATSVPVLKFTLNGSGTITNLTFKTVGVGAAGAVTAYLYDGATRLTSGKSFNTTTKEANFNVNWTLAGSKTYTVSVDVSAAAATNDQHQIVLSAINGNAITGISGNTFTIGAQSVSTVSIQKLTTPSNPKVGQMGAEIANFKLTGGTNDSWVSGITLTQSGTINTDEIKNFVLKQGSTTIATSSAISGGDKIVLTFSSPYSLLSGAVKEFRLYADISGRPGRTISTYVDETTDLKVTDALYGFGAAVTNTNYGSGAPMMVTTEGGNLTVAFNGPVTGDVSKGGQDVVLMSFSLSAVAPVEVRNTYLTINGTAGANQFVRGSAGTNYFSDIKIRRADTKQVLAGPVTYTVANSATSTGTLTLTDDYSLNGTVPLEVTADLSNTEDGAAEFFGQGYKVTLGNGGTIFGAADVKYDGSNDFVATTDIVPNTSIVANQQTVRSSSLKVGVSTFVGNSTHVKGATGAQVVAFSLTAGSDSSIKVSKFIVNPRVDTDLDATYGNDTNANTVVASATLWKSNQDGSLTKLDGPRGVTGGIDAEQITFENFTDNVIAGQSALYIVSVDLTTTAGTGGDSLAVTITSASNIVAEDKDNNSVTATTSAGAAIVNVNDTANNNPLVPVVAATVNSVGTLAISLDTADSQYKERLVQMGASNQKALRVKAKGTNEAFTVTDARITATGTPANVTSVTVTYPTNKEQTVFESKTSAFVSGIAQFSGLNWYVTKDNDSYLTATATVNTDTNGASSVQAGNADTFALRFEAQDSCGVGCGDFGQSPAIIKVVGQSSGSDATTSGNTDATGNNLRVRKTVLTINKHATSPSGTNVAPGLNDYLTFTVANSSGNTATISDLTFKVSGGDGAGTSDWVCSGGSVDTTGIKVFDLDNLSTNLVTGESVTNGTAGTQCDGVTANAADAAFYTVTFATPISISAGSTKTFKVQADTSGASSSNDDAFRIDIVAEVDGTFDDATSGTAMQWNDGVNTVNGYKVENLPVTGGNFSF